MRVWRIRLTRCSRLSTFRNKLPVTFWAGVFSVFYEASRAIGTVHQWEAADDILVRRRYRFTYSDFQAYG
jgi:hypothetical protein